MNIHALIAAVLFACTPPLTSAQTDSDADSSPSETYNISTLNQKVVQLYKNGQYQKAVELAKKSIEISEKIYGPVHANTASSLNNLATIFQSIGRYEDAIPLFIRALQIREKALGQDSIYTAASLNNLAVLFLAMGRYNDALPLFRRTLKIFEKKLEADHPLIVSSINNLAELFRNMGRYDDALPLYRRALQAREKVPGPNHPDTATTLNNLALLFNSTGNYNEALNLHRRAFQVREKALGGEHPHTADSLNNLAETLLVMGRYDEALTLHRRALQIREKALGADHPDTAASLNNLANLFRTMGQYDEALPLYRRALQIQERVLGTDHPNTAITVNNLASLLESMGNNEDALVLYRRALQIREKTLGANHPDTAASLNNLAEILRFTGHYDETLTLHLRALQIREKTLGADHPSTAVSLNNLAINFESTGHYNEALTFFRRALQISITSNITNTKDIYNAVDYLSKFSANLAYFIIKHHSTNDVDEAIFYYKLSVNTRQRMRAGTKGMDKTTRDSFTQQVADVYQELARLLIQRGRLDEAERVLLMLKESDLYDFLRRSGSASDTSQEVLRWTADEDRLNQSLLKIARAWQTYNADWHTLDEKQKRGEIKDDAPEFAQLASQRQQIETQTDNQLNDALERFRDGLREMALNNQKSFEIARTTLAQKLSDIQQLSGAPSPRTAGLVLLPGKRGLTMVVTTELGAVPLMVPVDEDTLVKLVQELREALRTRGDYRTAAKALHQYLIAPAEQQLGQQAAIQQWAILPYGALRNLPFATLMNATGQHLIERYALVTLTADGEGGFSGLDTAPKTEWRSAGFGASIADSAFNNVALPGVRTELCGIVSDPSEAAECQAQTSGVIPGRRYLNAHFTSAKLNLLMGPPTSTQAPSLLHIATHFSIDKSMLLLGDGGTLTLKTIGQWKPRLGHYDLVALSACDSGKTEAGVESLGGLFRKLGAKSVLATLWPLADVGAGPLMVEFYRQRGAQRVMAKSEALRRAQLAMLRGELKNPDNPATDLRHPYYWAGYVLMGNWL